MGVDCLEDVGKRYEIDEVVVHPDFVWSFHGDDIALVKVKGDIEFNDQVQPIPLSSREYSENSDALFTPWDKFDVSDSSSSVFQFSKHMEKITKASIFLIF